MINVLTIASYRFLPAIMGGQKGIACFNKYLSKLVKLTCVTISDNADGEQGDYELLAVLSGSRLRYVYFFYFFTLKRIIQERNITHLILEHPYYGWLGWLLKNRLKIKLIIHSHNIEALRFKDFGKWWWRLMWWYEKKVHRAADMSFFITAEDRQYAILHFKLQEDKCAVITYGIEQNGACTQTEKADAKKTVCQMHNISTNKLLLLYSGTLYYKPNLKGLDTILNDINPLLLKLHDIDYAIVICGSHLPGQYRELEAYKNKNIVYAGFVEDIDLYFRASDIFMNPISEGGGIKTKLVEALAGNGSAVSFVNGAYGVPVEITNNKLQVVANNNSKAFVEAINKSRKTLQENIPDTFFKHFYWGNIASEAAEKIRSLS